MIKDKEEGYMIYVTERSNCKSTKFVEHVNAFGDSGGFEVLLALIQSPDTNLTATYYICDLLSNCFRMYHKAFIDHYLQRLADAVE